ncbi:hypothetical protein MIH18_00905 [Marinobacter sp. M3C]|uniref:hypothetical protein n=1 Tax=Marinobacter sp. M3C TaxID=2917715 RepID=UPI00200D7F8E|nr:MULTISPECIES: hypothetical protein [unclassified Marinobacter]MCL1476204.1 hypothetical protein [Marinobacter sp.]MCL1482955.1 hypothetical protein [Marinobacter sp.]MCL1488772.1 hypothetical protein [Marinobacter sp.]UQG58145.1 hypothetical protein MIH16_11150 [Marinobacter sp. M4C]UQG60557.1 hypothetical protein MIH18_00905 [Marinobacter sp. M3C]
MSVHGLAFKEVRIPLDQDDTYTAIAQHTDAGKVPVLKDGDLTVCDSLQFANTFQSSIWMAVDGRALFVHEQTQDPAVLKCTRASRRFEANCQ